METINASFSSYKDSNVYGNCPAISAHMAKSISFFSRAAAKEFVFPTTKLQTILGFSLLNRARILGTIFVIESIIPILIVPTSSFCIAFACSVTNFQWLIRSSTSSANIFPAGVNSASHPL